MPAGTGLTVLGTMGSTPPQASGMFMATVRLVKAETCPTAVAGVPTGIRAIGSSPMLRVS